MTGDPTTTALKPHSTYKATSLPWLEKVPETWDACRIKTIFRESQDRREGKNLELLSLTRAKGLIPQSQSDNATLLAEDLSNYKVCHPSDIVMNRMQAWSGMFAVPRQEGVVSPDYSVFSPTKRGQIRFFEHLFKTPALVEQFAKYSKGIGSGFNRLYSEDFGDVRIPVPPPDEQTAIVRFLDHADAQIQYYIAGKERLIALLEEERQALVHQAVTRGLDPSVRLKPSGVEWLGQVPEHWETLRVRHFSKVGNGCTPQRDNAAYWTEGVHPWLNSSSVNQGTITKADQFVTDLALSECHLPRLRPGSVLVGITGQGKTRGMSAVLCMDATINQHMAFITLKTGRVSSHYLHMYLTAAYSELRAISNSSGSTKDALTCEDIKHFMVVLPPRDEQERLLSEVRRELASVDNAVDLARRQIDLMNEYRTRLIADVVTGQLDVREAAAQLPAAP